MASSNASASRQHIATADVLLIALKKAELQQQTLSLETGGVCDQSSPFAVESSMDIDQLPSSWATPPMSPPYPNAVPNSAPSTAGSDPASPFYPMPPPPSPCIVNPTLENSPVEQTAGHDVSTMSFPDLIDKCAELFMPESTATSAQLEQEEDMQAKAHWNDYLQTLSGDTDFTDLVRLTQTMLSEMNSPNDHQDHSPTLHLESRLPCTSAQESRQISNESQGTLEIHHIDKETVAIVSQNVFPSSNNGQDESVEELVIRLKKQIRNSSFLQENPPSGDPLW
jgi:hypothetical protein